MAQLAILQQPSQGGVLSFQLSGFTPNDTAWVSVVGGGGATFKLDYNGDVTDAFQLSEPSGDYYLEAHDTGNVHFVTTPFSIGGVPTPNTDPGTSLPSTSILKATRVWSGSPNQASAVLDTAFAQGERGVITIHNTFSMSQNPASSGVGISNPPGLTYRDYVVSTIQSKINAGGGVLWQNVDSPDDFTVRVYFSTGLAPLALIGIIIAAGVILALVIHTIDVDRITAQQSQDLTQVQKDAYTAAVQAILADPNMTATDKATTLANLATNASQNLQTQAASSDFLSFLKTPITVILILVALAIILPLVLSAVKR